MDDTCENAMRQVAALLMLSAVNSGLLSDIHGLVRVPMREDAPEFTIVDVRTIHRLAHLIPGRERRWPGNSRIDLRTLNAAYQGIRKRRGLEACCAGITWYSLSFPIRKNSPWHIVKLYMYDI